jgi:hypothetical protein
MDPRLSPYSPGAGTRPVAFRGREDIVEEFEIILDRLEAGRAAAAPLITGPRGSGKTVLFNALVDLARARGWAVGAEEAVPGAPLPTLVALLAREALLSMSTRHRLTDRIRRALGVLKAFASVSVVGIRLDIDVDAVTGTADTGILELDLRRLLVELGEIAAAQGTGVLFALDEVHTLGQEDLRHLDSALHATAQRGLPVAFLGSGLFPSWQRGDTLDVASPFASSFGARVGSLTSVRLRPLEAVHAERVLVDSAETENARFTASALAEAVAFCEGNPWLLQSVGAYAWEAADSSPVQADDVLAAIRQIEARLHEWFFPRLLRSCSEQELRVLSSLAGAGADGPVRGDVVQNALDFDIKPALLSLGRMDLVSIMGMSYSLSRIFLQISVPHLWKHLST